MLRILIGMAIGAGIGGLIGWSQVLCFDGACPLTGSWAGGAMLGAFLGFMLSGGCPACSGGACALPKGKREAADTEADIDDGNVSNR